MAIVIFPVTSGGTTFTTGTYAARPTPAVLGAGNFYIATDVGGEIYQSNGAAYTLMNSGGGEIGYAEVSTTFQTLSNVYVDIPGMGFYAMVGERPLVMEFEGHVKNAVGKAAIVGFVANGVGPQQGDKVFWTTTVNYQTAVAEARIPAGVLTPGNIYYFKAQLRADIATAGTAEVYGDATWRSFLRLITS